jgi:predicted esterase
MKGSSSRPWWILDSYLEHDMRAANRWDDVVRFPFRRPCCGGDHRADRDIQVRWWSEELSKNQYDGIIGLSQGAAMAALLVSMVSLVPGTYSVLRGLG